MDFKPFDKVLVRYTANEQWEPAFYSHSIMPTSILFHCMFNNNYNFTDNNIIKFEGNEELCFKKTESSWDPMNNEIIAVHFDENNGSSWIPAIFISKYSNNTFRVQIFSEIGRHTRNVNINDCRKFSVVFSDDSVLPKR